jgi:hypothetical protein
MSNLNHVAIRDTSKEKLCFESFDSNSVLSIWSNGKLLGFIIDGALHPYDGYTHPLDDRLSYDENIIRNEIYALHGEDPIQEMLSLKSDVQI